MGDRLVIQVRKNKEFVAALYSHWAAADGDVVYDRLLEKINRIDDKLSFKEYQVYIVEAINNVLVDYNSNLITPGILIRSDILDVPYVSKTNKQFLSDHPEFKKSTDHNAFMTVDEKMWYLWDSIAEATEDIDVGEESFADYSDEIIEKLKIWEKSFEKSKNTYLNI